LVKYRNNISAIGVDRCQRNRLHHSEYRSFAVMASTGPHLETEADRIREQRKERLRRAFPKIDVDGTGPRSG
jgi:hypothetical protein